MKAFLYTLFIRSWKWNPFKKLSLLFFRFLGINYDKYIRDLWFTGRFKVQLEGSFLYLYANKTDKGMLQIFYQGLDKSWDAYSILIWEKLAKRVTTIFDIGANIGLYALAGKAVNPTAQVYAFEPSIHALDMLNKNIEVNRFKIEVEEIALSNKIGSAEFYDLQKGSAASSLVQENQQSEQDHHNKRIVQLVTFEQFVQEKKMNKIDLISIDVELHEPEVLEGMGNLIKLHTPDFIIEVLNNEIGKKIETFFTGIDYLFYEINEREKTILPKPHLERKDEHQTHSFNFLVCKSDTAKYLGLL